MVEDGYVLKICSAGSYQVGKTSLIHRYAENTFSENYLPTLGLDIATKRIMVEDKPIKLILIDTAGQEVFGNIRKSYFNGAAGCLIVYDITRRESFDSLDRWVAEFRSNKHRETTPIVIIGNKNDLEADRIVDPEEGKAFAEAKGNLPFYECSAKLGGPEIPEIFVNLAREYLEVVQR